MNNKMIYIADDEENIRNLIKAYLIKEGYKVQAYNTGDKLLEAFNADRPDMVILDIMMPGSDGYEICREIRKKSRIPIIFISAKDEEIDRILGLELGSDDYISKPFSPREMVVRVKNIFKRIDEKEEEKQVINCRDLVINVNERSVKINGVELDITNKEYELLYLLCVNKNQAFSREKIIEKIWGYDYVGEARPVDDLIKRLRKKLKTEKGSFKIKTIWGYGYKVEE